MTLRYHYTIYGMRLESTRPLPDMLPDTADRAPDLLLHWNAEGDGARLPEPQWVQVHTPELQHKRGITLWEAQTAAGLYRRLGYSVGQSDVGFVLDPLLRHLWVQAPPSVSADALLPYLIGPVLGCVLRWRGVICLHASVVAIDGSAIVLLGAKKAGKSTTALALSRHGAAILSDDIAALTPDLGGILVQPGAPQVRLWPATLHHLYGASNHLPKVYADRDKRYLDIALESAPARHHPTPLRLLACYYLGPRRSDITAPIILPLTRQDRLMSLLAHTFASYSVYGALRGRELTLLGEVAHKIPIKRIVRPDDLDTLSALSEAILTDLRSSLAQPAELCVGRQ